MNLPGVTDDHFDRYSAIHGAGHINRVIVLGQILIRRAEETIPTPGLTARWAKPLWAAAFTHDLARRNDEVCRWHGLWAVEERLPKLIPFFLDHGVSKADIPAIATAVECHSLPDELQRDHEHWMLTALLKDADALDRVRLGHGAKTDPSYLRLPCTRQLIGTAEKLYAVTALSDCTKRSNLRELWQTLTGITVKDRVF